MSFLNIQIGGSVFEHQDSRSKNFTAKFDIEAARRSDTPFGPQERDAIEWTKAHSKMYDEAIAYIESCRLETDRKDALAINFARNRDADEALKHREQVEIPRELRDRGDRPEPVVTEPLSDTRPLTVGRPELEKKGTA